MKKLNLILLSILILVLAASCDPKPKMCTVVLNGNGGTVNGAESYTTEVVEGTMISTILEDVQTVWPGHHFHGYALSSEEQVFANMYHASNDYMITEDTEFYAGWREEHYLWFYSLSYSNSPSFPYSEVYTYGQKHNFTTTVPTRDGYTFIGWFSQAEGGEQYVRGEGFVTGGGTYYAHWAPAE